MIKNEEVKKCARLARIKVSDDKLEYMSMQLSKIMDMIDILKEVDTENASPLTSVLDETARMRNDVVTEQNIEAKLFANVPGKDSEFAKEIKCYIVPKVIE